MSTFAKIGAVIVLFALAAYSVSVLTEQRTRRIGSRVLTFLTAGVILDIAATVFMILGSSKGGFTLHGLLGYSSLGGMLLDTVLIWRFSLAHPPGTPVSRGLHLYTRFAYGWWIAAFVTGGMLVAMR